MRSSAAGVNRIWKLSNAGPSASTSIRSRPNRSASLSRVSTLLWRTFCQSLIANELRVQWEGGKRREGGRSALLSDGEEIGLRLGQLDAGQELGSRPVVRRGDGFAGALERELADLTNERGVFDAGDERHAGQAGIV